MDAAAADAVQIAPVGVDAPQVDATMLAPPASAGPMPSEPMSVFPEDDEEAECRVCRGEAEEDRRLFAPCKCSGSIRFTHADCLEQWLEHSGKTFCELCRHEFEFKPLYDANAPDVLPWSELLGTVLRITLLKWLPFALRGIVVLVLWLVVAPWCTSWLYRMWLLRASAMVNVNFSERFDMPHVVSDVFSGIILIIGIVFSFLALMSFADFLRFHLDQHEDPIEDPLPPRAPARRDLNAAGVNGNAGVHLGEVPFLNVQRNDLDGPRIIEEDHESDDSSDEEDDWMNRRGGMAADEELRRPILGEERELAGGDAREPEPLEARDGVRRRRVPNANAGAEENGAPNNAEANVRNRRPDAPVVARNLPRNNRPAPPPQNREWDDDFDHMEINIAMDELLGLRGDIAVLFRNVSWFLAFNGAYLGLFAFIPYTLGSTITSACGKILSAIPTSKFSALNPASIGPDTSVIPFFVHMLQQSVNSARINGDCLQLVDLCTCAMGYLSICFTIVLWRFMVTTASSYIHRPLMGGLLWALRCLTAIVKVSTLLLLKMVILPIILGIGIDFATLHLFMITPQQRIAFCLQNMVGALLVHWVLGITFMLFVTVSVLQLREVVHPDMLAKVIRPQEAHPDLLRSLLSEKCVKHARRMILSLVIYAGLLLVLVHVPVRLAHLAAPQLFPLVLRFQHYSPEIQVPLELLVVHLVVLGVLEHAKNAIGRFEHIGLTFVCERLGLSEYLLPRVEAKWRGAKNAIVVLPPPPLHFHPQAVLPPEQLLVQGHRYLPWPEEGVDDPQPMEYDLLPRKVPSHLPLRIAGLVFCGWLASTVAMATFVFGPLFIGRVCTAPLERITGIAHEPLAMAAGVQIAWYIVNGISALNLLTLPEDQIEASLLRRGYCVRNISPVNAVVSVVGWAFVCPFLLGYFVSACCPIAQASWLESFWLGYLLFNLGAWFICCFRSKNNRRRRNRRDAIAGDLDEDFMDMVEPEDDDEFDEEEIEEPAAAVGNEAQGFIDAIRKCYQQVMFNVTIHDDEVLRLATDDIRDRCFDVEMFLTQVLKPIVIVLLAMILGPTLATAAATLFVPSEPGESEKHFALAACSMGSLCLLMSSQDQLQRWMSNLRESVRNERYLIGRQLQDMAR
ncbi:TPA: hypothetical protein N0F65_004428 [Lagenidium giganteum]|uniref:RING-type E3 ubiquitin transferase n=1 Tax=Lagenidium giganteum TaxID=4803 RepID=A0AAV2ZF58_9STRA|nr:TPA: hypothetical protein N0F65_004428 [Lagenidium giganteum]